MAYTVSKTINGRTYLYRVERTRDPESGRVRNRWTYLGRPAPGSDAAPVDAAPRAARGTTRQRLIDATERLLERNDADVTPSAIAAEAGVAHGTFYRHFRDRREALEAVVNHLRATRGAVDEGLDDDVESAEAARAGLRTWLIRKLAIMRERPEFLAGFYRLAAGDAKIAAWRAERRDELLARFGQHLAALVRRGFARLDDPLATARILYTIYDGLYRQLIVDGNPIDDAVTCAAADAVERIVFCNT
jgi:AcrR family transcriptional regulator